MISSVRQAGSRPVAPSTRSTSAARPAWESWRLETLTLIPSFDHRGCRRCHSRVCRHASASIHSPSSTTSPVSSADGDEEIGQEHAPARMPPARERLETDHRAGVEIHDRLVEGDDLLPLDRASEIGLEPQRGDRALVHVAGEDLVAGATAHLGPVHRRVRVPQHVLGGLVARARQRDADADAGEHLVPPHLAAGRPPPRGFARPRPWRPPRSGRRRAGR